MAGLGAQQGVDGDVVGALGQGLERDALDAERGEPLVVDVGIAGDDVGVERGDAPREGAADVAETDDAHGLAV